MAARTLLQIASIAGFALVPFDEPGTPIDLAPISFTEMFMHNGSVFLLWLAGGVTLGFAFLGLAGLSSATSDLSIGAALQRNGIETFTHPPMPSSSCPR